MKGCVTALCDSHEAHPAKGTAPGPLMKTTAPDCDFRARLSLQRAPLRTALSIDPGKVMRFAAEAAGTPADAGPAFSLRLSAAGTDALQGHAQAFFLGLQPCLNPLAGRRGLHCSSLGLRKGCGLSARGKPWTEGQCWCRYPFRAP